MWCLLRALPVMIGHLIPHDSQEWELFRLLREIMNYSFLPAHSHGSVSYLELAVNDHHELFIKLFKNSNDLIPKHHNLSHYAEAIRRNGPLTQFNAMRSESKHQMAKITAILTCNFSNVPLTVARQYQLHSFAKWKEGDVHPLTDLAGVCSKRR